MNASPRDITRPETYRHYYSPGGVWRHEPYVPDGFGQEPGSPTLLAALVVAGGNAKLKEQKRNEQKKDEQLQRMKEILAREDASAGGPLPALPALPWPVLPAWHLIAEPDVMIVPVQGDAAEEQSAPDS